MWKFSAFVSVFDLASSVTKERAVQGVPWGLKWGEMGHLRQGANSKYEAAKVKAQRPHNAALYPGVKWLSSLR